MQEVSEKYNNDSYRERHALSVERLRTLPFEESVEDSYIAYFRLVALFLLEVENVRIQVESGKWDQYNEEDMRQINEILYSDIVGDAYEKSYANPKYAKISFTAAQSRNTARTQKTNFMMCWKKFRRFVKTLVSHHWLHLLLRSLELRLCLTFLWAKDTKWLPKKPKIFFLENTVLL